MQQTDQMSHRAEGLLTEQKMERRKWEIGWKQSLSNLCFHFRDLGLRALFEDPTTVTDPTTMTGVFPYKWEAALSLSSPLKLHSPSHFFTPDSLNHKLFPQVVTPDLFSFWLKNFICGSLIKGSGKEQEKLQFPYEPFDMKLNIKYHKGTMFAKETILKCGLYKSWCVCSCKSLMENSEHVSEKLLSIFIILNNKFNCRKRDVFKICVMASS